MRGDVFSRVLKGGAVSGSASAVVAKREWAKRVGKFDESIVLGEDGDYWLRLAQYARFDYVDEPLTLIRRHSKQTQAHDGWSYRLRQSADHVRITSKWAKEARNYPGVLAHIRRRMLFPAFSPDMALAERIKSPAKIAEAIWPIADPNLMRAVWGNRFFMIYFSGLFIGSYIISRMILGKIREARRKTAAFFNRAEDT